MLAVQAEEAALRKDDFGDQNVHATLGHLISGLPEPYSLVLGCVEIEGASIADVADFMGLSKASLRLIYIEGRRRLRAMVLANTEGGAL